MAPRKPARKTRPGARKARRKPADEIASKRELIVAVTGHRAFGKRGKQVAAAVRSELKRIAKAHPKTPAVVVSALAEGADRLVARLAHEILDARLVAVLPMPAKDYMMDFATAESRRDFKQLLKSADRVVDGPILTKGRKWKSYTEERNHQYAWGGAYVAKNADVLMTLWDGKPARGTGGTAYVVDWFLGGRTPRRYAMSRWLMRSAPSPHKASLVHINPETGTVKRKRALR